MEILHTLFTDNKISKQGPLTLTTYVSMLLPMVCDRGGTRWIILFTLYIIHLYILCVCVVSRPQGVERDRMRGLEGRYYERPQGRPGRGNPPVLFLLSPSSFLLRSLIPYSCPSTGVGRRTGGQGEWDL